MGEKVAHNHPLRADLSSTKRLDRTAPICTLAAEPGAGMPKQRKRAGRPSGRNHDGGRSGDRDADRPRPRHHLCPAGRAERFPVRGIVRGAGPAAHGAHPPRAGRRLYGARRRAGDRQAGGLRRGAGTRAAQCRGGAAHRLWHECAGARPDRANPRRRYRPRSRPAARDPRPGRHHQTAGRSLCADPQAGAGVAGNGAGDAGDEQPAGQGRRCSNAPSTCGANPGR